ncbi:hypothetical protein BDL97_02G086700 [Sphagnum fallax]|nr:hypothetical protein BDL97_02G086700 [Sphagnum fallax]
MALTPFHDKDKDQQQQQQIAPWDPIAIDPFEMMGSFFDHSPIFPMFQNIFGGGSSTRVDWKETSDSHILKADLPGLKKEDLRVSLENGNTLQILGHRQNEEIDKSDTWHRVERNHNSFVRRFHLPPNVHVNGMKTKVEHGVLTITVPKDKNYKPKPSSSIPIPVQWES